MAAAVFDLLNFGCHERTLSARGVPNLRMRPLLPQVLVSVEGETMGNMIVVALLAALVLGSEIVLRRVRPRPLRLRASQSMKSTRHTGGRRLQS